MKHRWYDDVAERCSDLVSRAPFFLFCGLAVLIWLPSFPLFEDLEEWQFPINTFTTVVTFLLVALLQNAQRRSDQAVHRKLDAIADALADYMQHSDDVDGQHIDRDVAELRDAAGVHLAPTAARSRKAASSRSTATR